MAWTPYVCTQHSEFPSPLVFEKQEDAQAAADSQASYLRGVFLKIISAEARPTESMPNHVVRDGRLVRIKWSTSKP